jgi:hypothetical protein
MLGRRSFHATNIGAELSAFTEIRFSAQAAGENRLDCVFLASAATRRGFRSRA